MKNRLIKILQDMSRVAFTNEEKTEYMIEHDVLPIVRCKDCKHGTLEGEYILCWMIGEDRNKPMHFCGYGARRSEE